MSVKMTKIQELEAELKVYVSECARMRKVAEIAVKVSGEIDVARITRQAQEDAERYEAEIARLRDELGHKQGHH